MGGGDELRVGYLALYAAEDDAPYDRTIIAALTRCNPARLQYAFRGMSKREADARPYGPHTLALTSTTFGFGPWARDLHIDYHELALV